jgi:hypothetical protein
MTDRDKKDNKEERNPETTIPSFTTFPIANAHTLDIDTRVSIPSEDDLMEGREWVNENQK